jgi:TonB-dependent SusC/RagA subfamily outer membrane receptor
LYVNYIEQLNSNHKKTAMLKTTLVLLLMLLTGSLYAQNDFPQQIAEKFATYQAARPQEKVYLHLDKPYSAVGDTIWFKGYIVEANRQAIDTVSRVLYVDLVNEATGKVTISHRYALINGTTNGRFVLADSILSGSYRIRAYTNYMRNFSEDFFFNQKLQIYKETTALTIPDTNTIDVQFFAEGGNLVAALSNRIAYKAINAFGYGIDIDGFVTSSAGDTVVAFASMHLGMGNFSFTPDATKTYSANVRKKNGVWRTIALPKVSAEGFALQIDNVSNKNNVRVIISVNKNIKTGGQATLLAQGRGEVRFSAAIPLTRKTILVNIPRNQLGEGITQITLFDDKNQPTCERLVWGNKPKALTVSIKTDKPTYKLRERTEVSVTVSDYLGKPVEGSFSMAVIDQKQGNQHEYDQNIVSYMALTSDLKGFIEKPSYYFDSTQAEAPFRLDLLLMTQGWRRFVWKDVIEFDTTSAPQFFIESGLSLKGNVTKTNGKNAGIVNLTTAMTQGEAQTLFKADSDDKGNFVFSDLNYYDSTSFTIQAATPKGNKDLTIKVESFIPPKPQSIAGNWPTDKGQADLLASYMAQMADYRRFEAAFRNSTDKTIDEVVIKAKRAKEKDPRKTYTTASNTLKTEDLAGTGALNIIEAIQNRIPGVNITGSGSTVKVNIRASANFSGAVDPLFVLDGIPTELQQLVNTSVNDVESIDVLKGPQASIYGSRGAGGVICVYTKRGNRLYDWSKDKSPGVKGVKIMGFEVERAFYSPKYDVPQAATKPDLRSTVYWNANLKTDKEGKAKVSFYNNDNSNTRISIRVEGLATNGKAWAGLQNYGQ